ncbi:ubiquinol-cytochrome c reductase iron-sulfur subunit [Helicobacter sp. 13S00401-1]|uniref:ubiquinol-cytochrome c reductase iron-sulfur subunit n=1 Tax=Helicobacter sp. 13S00401-1 TaxID=1905758 RepID=UPI000BA6DF24|nr:ubiquinol-cytochrome c reductase iron-sulfur subunit [Helicobacter sp. 13S00401-1]PAF48620.1 ubiquinol-cytochrome c reductase iron-sulfur subunit [Helicobacter sp. 13S00401-1]
MADDVNEVKDVKRRDFMGMTVGGFAILGVIATIYGIKRTWDPLPSIVSAGFTTVDLAGMKEGEFRTTTWRGKPIYMRRKRSTENFVAYRDFKLGDGAYTIGIQICTHLGCIPIWKPDINQFFCPCHGGEYTEDGINIAGTPPPRPFDMPPFKVTGATTLLLGETGKEYEDMMKAKA